MISDGYLAKWVYSLVREELDRHCFRATVTGTSGNKVLIQRTGEVSADAQAYPRLSSYSPTNGDEVILHQIGGSLIVLGKVTR